MSDDAPDSPGGDAPGEPGPTTPDEGSGSESGESAGSEAGEVTTDAGTTEEATDGTTPGHETGVTHGVGTGSRAGATDGPGEADDPSRHEGRTFGRRGWLLVAWLVVALVVVPAYLFFYPRASDTLGLFGLGYRDTYLVLPLVPALILGALAVWATTRP